MKHLMCLSTVLLLLAAPLAVVAGPDGPEGPKGDGVPDCECKMLGSWMGYDLDGNGWWLSSAHGQNASHGTMALEPLHAGQYFPPELEIVGGTELKGAWQRTGRYTYDWVVIGFMLNAEGANVAIARLSGWSEIGEDCNTMMVNDMVVERFLPNADLATDVPEQVLPFPPFPGLRISAELPELP